MLLLGVGSESEAISAGGDIVAVLGGGAVAMTGEVAATTTG